MKQLCVIKLDDQFYIMDLIINEHRPTPYNTQDEAQKVIDLQMYLCEIMCSR